MKMDIFWAHCFIIHFNCNCTRLNVQQFISQDVWNALVAHVTHAFCVRVCVQTLVIKVCGVILSVAGGLAVGKVR